MKPPTLASARAERAVQVLLKLREIKVEHARVRLLEKRTEIARLQQELVRLRKRREAVIRRGGERVLRERLLLDALMRIALERRSSMRDLEQAAAGLLAEYLASKSQCDAARSLRGRQSLARERLRERRADELASDLAGSRKWREPREYTEGPWEA